MRYTFLAIAFTIVFFNFSCERKKEVQDTPIVKTSVKEDSLQRVIEQLHNRNDNMSVMKLNVLNILRQINEAEGRITTVAKKDPESKEITENLVFIEQKLKEYKKALADMKQLMRNTKDASEKEIENFKKMIQELEDQLNTKNTEIAELRRQIEEKDSLLFGQQIKLEEQEEAIEQLEGENAEKEKELIEKETTLNTAWFVFGTEKELKEQNILKDGKVLTSDAINKEYFTSIDIRVRKNIPLYAKKAKVLTSHPSDSYELIKDSKNEYTLQITNSEAFWSTSKYLVISVK
jgi:DNA repair exonuclease SbcCD ATPase subunit